jgi:hypothetical protein
VDIKLLTDSTPDDRVDADQLARFPKFSPAHAISCSTTAALKTPRTPIRPVIAIVVEHPAVDPATAVGFRP